MATEIFEDLTPVLNHPAREGIARALGCGSFWEPGDVAGWRVIDIPHACEGAHEPDSMFAANERAIEDELEGLHDDHDSEEGECCVDCGDGLWAVREGCPALEALIRLRDALESYPCLNEDLWSEIETERAEEAWDNWGCREWAERQADEHGGSDVLREFCIDHAADLFAAADRRARDAARSWDYRTQGHRGAPRELYVETSEDCYVMRDLTRAELAAAVHEVRRIGDDPELALYQALRRLARTSICPAWRERLRGVTTAAEAILRAERDGWPLTEARTFIVPARMGDGWAEVRYQLGMDRLDLAFAEAERLLGGLS